MGGEGGYEFGQRSISYETLMLSVSQAICLIFSFLNFKTKCSVKKHCTRRYLNAVVNIGRDVLLFSQTFIVKYSI